MTLSRLRPGDAAPALQLPIVGGGTFDLSSARIDTFLIIEVYRGLHCPRCRLHLSDLASKLPHFSRRGVSAIAISMDGADRAETARSDWHLGELPVGYGLDADTAEAWGLFLSNAINAQETRIFAEPATFLIAPDRTVYSIFLNSTPFARFHFADLLEAVDAIQARNYPPRGTYRHQHGEMEATSCPI